MLQRLLLHELEVHCCYGRAPLCAHGSRISGSVRAGDCGTVQSVQDTSRTCWRLGRIVPSTLYTLPRALRERFLWA